MIERSKIIITGGSGLLGGELKRLLPDAKYPTSSEFNVTNYDQMEDYVASRGCKAILHAAAFTSPPKIDKEPAKAVEANIIGTANVVKLCMKHDLYLVYISTDYVFSGDEGNYSEEDPVYPVNKYAWSKLGGECSVRLYDNSLIIRTTFGPNEFPYEKAFADQWTSRECVKDIAKKVSILLEKAAKGVVHVGGRRRTVLEYARSLAGKKEIGPLSVKDVNFKVPRDTSLNVSLYNKLIG